MFLDRTYFEGEIYLPTNEVLIPNRTSVGVAALTQSAGQNNLALFISVYEEDYLKKLLGKIYHVFIDEMISDIYSERTQQLYKKIYSTKQILKTKNGVPFKDSIPYSPAAYYVYYEYMRANRSQTSMKGEVRANIFEAQNLTVTPAVKLSDIWNRMSCESKDIQRWIIQSHLFDDVLHNHLHDEHSHRYGCYAIHFYASRFNFYDFGRLNIYSV